jgi:hypothetical protein
MQEETRGNAPLPRPLPCAGEGRKHERFFLGSSARASLPKHPKEGPRRSHPFILNSPSQAPLPTRAGEGPGERDVSCPKAPSWRFSWQTHVSPGRTDHPPRCKEAPRLSSSSGHGIKEPPRRYVGAPRRGGFTRERRGGGSAPGGAGSEGGVHLLVVDEQGAALRFHGGGPGRHRGGPGGGARGCRAGRRCRAGPRCGGGGRGAAGREDHRGHDEQQTTAERSGEGRTWHGRGLYHSSWWCCRGGRAAGGNDHQRTR